MKKTNIFILVSTVLFTAASGGCDFDLSMEDECSFDVPECRFGFVARCEWSDDPDSWFDGHYELVYDSCVETGRECVDDTEGAECVFVDEPCPMGRDSYCEQNELVSCDAGYVQTRKKCEGFRPYCVDNGQSASCSLFDSLCKIPGDWACRMDTGHRVICDESGFWQPSSGSCHRGTSCTEITNTNGSTISRCLFSDEPCPANVHSMCIEGTLASCERSGYPEYVQSAGFSGSYEVCLEIEEDGTTIAQYVLSDVPCPQNAVSMCIDDSLVLCNEYGYPVVTSRSPDPKGGGSITGPITCTNGCMETVTDGVIEASCLHDEE